MITVNKLEAQTDTVFWFVAPELSNDRYNSVTLDRPIVLNITTYDQPAEITISQPAAHGRMPSRSFHLTPKSTNSVDLTEWIDDIECFPANVVLDKGLKISSTSKISAYYEVNANGYNPDLFTLKGRNALGKEFYISSQFLLHNESHYHPYPYSSFNIVATEDNTSVTLTPSNNIVGHAAKISFKIFLNKGQTYAAVAANQSGESHLQGSHVISNKPIAVTLSDDELTGLSGTCKDLAGDQTVPINVIGNEYIAIKGKLNEREEVYILATQDNTTISIDGITKGAIQKGANFTTEITNKSTYIKTSHPVYVYQVSGISCEVGSAILPKINCTGSSNVSFIRTSNQELYITLLVRSGGQRYFLLNGNSGPISPDLFYPVPGTSGSWYEAIVQLAFNEGDLINVTNTKYLFHLGLLQGGDQHGAGFGYFSDFGQLKVKAESNDTVFDIGQKLKLYTDTISSIFYTWHGPNNLSSNSAFVNISSLSPENQGMYTLTALQTGCMSSKDNINIRVKEKAKSNIDTSIVIHPNVVLPDNPKFKRETPLNKTIITNDTLITIELYDNGEIDNDTISVYDNGHLIVNKNRVTDKPITLSTKWDKLNRTHEFVMVAENLGEISPNTSLMIITTIEGRHEVKISTNEEMNAKVIVQYNGTK